MTADGIYKMVKYYVTRVGCVVRVLVWFAISATAAMRSTTGGTFLFHHFWLLRVRELWSEGPEGRSPQAIRPQRSVASYREL